MNTGFAHSPRIVQLRVTQKLASRNQVDYCQARNLDQCFKHICYLPHPHRKLVRAWLLQATV